MSTVANDTTNPIGSSQTVPLMVLANTVSTITSNLDTNATTCPKDFPPLGTNWLYLMALITIICFVITITSNGIIFYLFWSTPSLRNNPSNIIAFNLSLSDLLLSTQWPSVIYCCLTQSKGILQYEVVCQTFGFISTVTGFASILTVLAMSVERAVVIRSSLLAKSRITIRVAAITTMLIWAGALVANLPPILQMVARYRIDPSNTGCFLDYLTLDEHRRTTNAYIFILTLCFFILPAIIIFISYMVILNAFKKSSNRLQRIDCELQSSVNSSSDRKSNATTAINNNNNNEGESNLDQGEGGEEGADSASGLQRNSITSASIAPIRSRFACLGHSLRLKMSYRLRQQQHLSQSDQIYYDSSPNSLSKGSSEREDAVDMRGSPKNCKTRNANTCYTIRRQDSPCSPELIQHQAISAPNSNSIELSRSNLRAPPRRTPSPIRPTTIDPVARVAQLARMDSANSGQLAALRLIPSTSSSISFSECSKRADASLCFLETSKFTFKAREIRDLSQTTATNSDDDLDQDSPMARPKSSSASPGMGPPSSSSCPQGREKNTNNQGNNNSRRRDQQSSIIKQSFSATLSKIASRPIGLNDSLRFSHNNTNSTIMKPPNQTYTRTDLQIRLAIMSFYLILLWLISWAPIALLSMINSLDSRCEKFSNLSIFLASTMTKMGPTFDVFIYGISHPKIKVRYRQIIMGLAMAGPLACRHIYLATLNLLGKSSGEVLNKSDTISSEGRANISE